MRPSRAGQCVDALIRTNSLTRRDQGERDLVTFFELCPSWNGSDNDLFVGINTQTFAVICNSAVWAVSLCVSAHQHRVPFLGIQPSNVPSIGSLEHMLNYSLNRLALLGTNHQFKWLEFIKWQHKCHYRHSWAPLEELVAKAVVIPHH